MDRYWIGVLNLLIAITGISGSGKDTFGEYLKESGIYKLLSYTTREIREGEKNGEDYYFLSKEEYKKLDKANDVFYAGNNYSFSNEDIKRISSKKDMVKYSVVNDNGLNYFKEVIPKENLIHVHLNVNIEEAIKRMKKRGDSKESIESRVQYYKEVETITSKILEKNADYVLEGSLEDYKEFARTLMKTINN